MQLSVQGLKSLFTLKAALAALITIGIYAILFLPAFLHSQFFFPFIVPKNIAFRIIVEVIFAAYLILVMTKKLPRPKFDWLTLAVASLFVVMVVSALSGENIRSSFLSTYERMSGILHYLHVVLFFLVVSQFARSKKQISQFLTFTLFVSLTIGLLALSQQFQIPVFLASSGGTRLTGTIGNAAFYGGYIVLNLFIILFFLLSSRQSKLQFQPKVWAWATVAFDLFIVLHELQARWRGLSAGLLSGVIDNIELIVIAVILNALAFWYLLTVAKAWRGLTTKIVLWSLFLFQGYILFHTQTRGAIIAFMAGLVLLSALMGHVSENPKIKKRYYSLGAFLIALQFLFYAVRDSQFVTESVVLARLGKEIPLVGVYFGILMLVFVWAYSFWRHKRSLKAIFLAVIFIMLLAGPYGAYKVRDQSWAQNSFPVNLVILPLNNFLTDAGSTTIESRVLTWRASWNGWHEKFWLGYGPENYYITFNKHFPIPIYKDAGSRVWFDRAHNFVFDWGVSTGILGLAAYISIFGVALWYLLTLYRSERSNRAVSALMALLVAFLIQNLFVFDTLNTDVLVFLVLASLVTLARNREQQREIEVAPATKPAWQIGAVVIALFLAVYYLNVKPALANHKLFVTLRDVNQQAISFDDAVDQFLESINLGLLGKDEARQQLSNFTLSQLGNDKISPESRLNGMRQALKELKKTVEDNPDNARYLSWLAQAYNRSARVDKTYAASALKVLDQARVLSPDRANLYYEYGQAYLLSGQTDQAIQALRQAVEFNPEVRESQINLGSVLILLDRHAEFDQFIAEVNTLKILTVADYLRFVDMYKIKNDVQRVLRLYQMAAENYPNDPAVYVSLAQSYKQLGENILGQRAFDEALKRNPDLEVTYEDL